MFTVFKFVTFFDIHLMAMTTFEILNFADFILPTNHIQKL